MIDIPTGTYSVERFSEGSWGTDGRYSRGAQANLSIDASIQPISGNMVNLLPEHRRNSESILIFTETRLYGSDEKESTGSDIIIYDGKRYEVFSVKKWAEVTDIEHYECMAQMQDGQGAGRNG